ncbi:sulfatase-like hydrolase/transferase [Castellaniella sp. GW247-6E4]|uniref:sulfatase-like hydrolase/transferase n=1 Tax=Castellaniella sp. GW247-6E4 TaxID=3140380 RepID=UPI0033160303
MKKSLPTLLAAASATLILAACDGGGSGGLASNAPPPASQTPNILFVIMDDVGIDQMASFGYGGLTAPTLPNMDAVAKAGVRFRNTWSMPECSPGRAAFFVGRYPIRTNIYQAIGPADLANSQLSPYDMTAPKMLKEANYESAMFGKFHLAGPEHNQAENATPSVLGWDYFYGWIGGLPGSIDTQAGDDGNALKTYQCGFVPGNGGVAGPGIGVGDVNAGACRYADNSCSMIRRTDLRQDPAGLQCLDSGGIFVPGQTCAAAAPASLQFDRQNGYYVSPLVIIDGGTVEEVPLTDPRARGYRTRIETDAAINWIKSRPASRPWMATVSYSAPHTPWQQPPGELLAGGLSVTGNLSCTDTGPGRIIQNEMTEAMDTEFGRLLVETGLARRAADGSLLYDPKASNTVIVIVGDNGTLGSAVKTPFQTDRAKGTAYQTGVWDPLIIAGPQVAQPDRDVEHMVNTVDLFQFFGEVAGIDAHQAVPRTIDSVGILPYLKDPGQGSLRTINFTIGGYNTQANGGRNGPCVISGSCTQIPISKSVCEDNQGAWWGSGYDDPSVVDNGGTGYLSCAAVNEALDGAGEPMITILPEISAAIRNDKYKLVENTVQTYIPGTGIVDPVVTKEFYAVDQAVPTPKLDNDDVILWKSGDPDLPAGEAKAALDALNTKFNEMMASNPPCPGDGNWDGVVDSRDTADWARINKDWGLSSVYDFVFAGPPADDTKRDGITDGADQAVIDANMNVTCDRSHGLY